MSDSDKPAFNTLAGNPYDFFEDGDVICVTTNAEVRKNGCAVMGRGCAEFVRDTLMFGAMKVIPFIHDSIAKYWAPTQWAF